MNVSYRWLRSIAPDIADSPQALADRLASYGAPVDALTDLGAPLRDVIIARVEEAIRHPNADKLSLTRVNAGGEILSVVCGAPNVRAGAYYPFAPVGATLPGGFAIGQRKIRGEMSQGMLCSARELDLGRDHEGIMELHGTFELGARFIEAVGLDDTRFEVDVTPNRPDLLSHWGIAREVAPGGVTSLVLPPFPAGTPLDLGFTDATAEGVTVRVDDAAACPRYIAVVIRGVQVGPSPEWLAARLRAVGQRPINNVVDATNYVLQELGQPLHAFDLARLGDAVVVRRARDGETLVTLDGTERRLTPEILVIADAARPVALAGIMGGRETEVTDTTRDVLLECALFEPRTVRNGRRALGMSTDASYRYERGVDPDVQRRAAQRCAELIAAVAGGTVGAVAAEVAAPAPARPTIRLRRKRAEQVLGGSMPVEHMAALLDGIGFRCVRRDDEALDVLVPGHRIYDIAREDDLVEEVARRHGYDAFPEDVRPFRPGTVPPDAMAVLEDRLRTLLVGRGFLEARSAAFAPAAEGDIPLMLPLASTESHLRRALLPGLLHRVEANFNVAARDIRLFEIGTVFAPGEPGGLPREATRIAAVFTGARQPEHWTGGAGGFDIWDLKDLLAALAGELGGTVEPHEPPAPFGEAAFRVAAADVTLGAGGEIAADAIDAPAWAGTVFGLEVDIRMEATEPRAVRFSALPAYPPIERDLALVAARGITAAAIEATILAGAGPLLEAAHVFDVYEGPGVAEGSRSIAFRLRFRSPDRTLTDEEVDVVVERILERLRDEHDIRRR